MEHETPQTEDPTAQANWLIAELRRRATLAAATENRDLHVSIDPTEERDLRRSADPVEERDRRRSADSLVRLTTALRG